MDATTDTRPAYQVGMKAANGLEIIEVTDEKVCVQDLSALEFRGYNSKKWFKVTSPTLVRLYGGQS